MAGPRACRPRSLNAADARFDPEYDTTYEVGLKSTWLDHHLLANIAVFESKYTGIQLNVQEGPSPVYQNAGDATIKGAELEVQAAFGGGFALNLAAGWMDAYYTSLNPCLVYNAVNGICDPANGLQTTQGGGGFTLSSDLPKTPEYKFSISPVWDIHLVNDNTLRLQADYVITAHMFNDGPNTALLCSSGNARAGCERALPAPQPAFRVDCGRHQSD